jgi:peptide deformylase
VTAQDIQGNTIEFTAQGMLAICIQHECDHLDGKLFVRLPIKPETRTHHQKTTRPIELTRALT